MDFDELDGFTEEKALMILRARELKKQINELRGRIAEENQNILDDEEWVMTPGLPQISQNEIYKDIANYKINVVFYGRQLQQLQEQLKEIESIDNCFPDIDYRVYMPIEEGVIPQQASKLAPLYS